MTIDRISFATQLAEGRKVLDIGGQKMAACDPDSPFAVLYSGIENAAVDYRIVDYQEQPSVDYILDFNRPESVSKVKEVIDAFQPEVIFCMETLEHVNYHFELMNAMAYGIQEYGSMVYITVPNNGNWVFNALNWNTDHSIAFLRDIAYRFITRSDLGQFNVWMMPCMQKYLWYWWIPYTLAFLQPFSWGFWVVPFQYEIPDKLHEIANKIRSFTEKHQSAQSC